MSLQFKNLKFVDFLVKEIGLTTQERKQWREDVLKETAEITESELRRDFYEPGNRGIPLYRLDVYCRILNISPALYIDYCKGIKRENKNHHVPN